MTIAEIIALVGVLVIAIGLWATWRKNGHDQARRDIAQAEKMASWKTEIKNDLKHINDELSSPDHGLIALVQGQSAFKTHCAEVSTRLTERVEANTKDINELKSKDK